MKRTIYTILQVIIFAATIAFSFWALEEGTKRTPHSWVTLLYVWTAVLWVLSVLSVVFRKKITSMKGLPMTMTILSALGFAGAAIDTYYAIDTLSQNVVQSAKVNQSLLCLGIWVVAICLSIFSRKLNKKQ